MIQKYLSIILSSVYILALFITVGCADDLRNRSVFDCGAGDAVISFYVDKISTTRAGNTYDFESDIDYAYLLFYSASASLENDKPLAAVRAEIDDNNPGTLKFKMPLRLNPDTDYKLLAVANADYYLPSGFNTFGEYIDSWCRDIDSSDNGILSLNCVTSITPETNEALPMICRMNNDSPFRFSMENGSYKVSSSLTFSRLVARIDVANIIKKDFIIEGVALCNWRDAVPVSASISQLGNQFGSIRGVLSGENSSETESVFIEMPQPDVSGVQQLKESIYCFPSVSYDAYIGDTESTALIIKAKYKDDIQSTYYRVNINMRANRSEVKPNTKYLVTIQSVRGRGEATPEEAYAAKESLIVLSVVEDWDLEGETFVMDDEGNFIVVSRGSIDFEADIVDNVDVRVLTSKNLVWSIEYLADNDVSASAFNVERISDMAISIGPKAENEEDVPLSGKCRVSATTNKGNQLAVDILLSQKVAEEKPYEPVIPTDKPFAIIPLDGERVKIDHAKQTIEIDGFDPNCFNSFIDIPFRVYINEEYKTSSHISIRHDLEWPTEGFCSKIKCDGYYYCSNSFVTTGNNRYMIYSQKDGKELNQTLATDANKFFDASAGDIVYISVGAMAPDDPAITDRTITLSYDFDKVEYKLVIKPRPVIIDDVILTDSNKSWLIFDRNIQKDSSSYSTYIGRMSDGKKRQAYNYLSQWYAVTIPFKYRDNLKSPAPENSHQLYMGVDVKYSNRNTLELNNLNNQNSLSDIWLSKYLFSDNQNRNSPYYESEKENIEKWGFPNEDVLNLCARRMHVSKMRMYLVSDVYAKSGRNQIPICCYWPYYGDPMGNTGINTYGYYMADDSKYPNSLMIIYCDKFKMNTFVPSSDISKYTGLSRLVRPLTSEELDDYKKNYLGYGSEPHKLTICHPDTYGSEGWLPY